MYLILTGYQHADQTDVTISVNMDNVFYISDRGDEGCKLKYVAGDSQGAVCVRESFKDINAALNPVAVYTQKEQPK